MISILVGFIVIASLLSIFYITGKMFSSSIAEHDDESDYIGQGFVVWMVIGFIGLFCFIVGKVILHFI
jgi:uncharacterized BrkB/YihY/UPF0761 family membrane protein